MAKILVIGNEISPTVKAALDAIASDLKVAISCLPASEISRDFEAASKSLLKSEIEELSEVITKEAMALNFTPNNRMHRRKGGAKALTEGVTYQPWRKRNKNY